MWVQDQHFVYAAKCPCFCDCIAVAPSRFPTPFLSDQFRRKRLSVSFIYRSIYHPSLPPSLSLYQSFSLSLSLSLFLSLSFSLSLSLFLFFSLSICIYIYLSLSLSLSLCLCVSLSLSLALALALSLSLSLSPPSPGPGVESVLLQRSRCRKWFSRAPRVECTLCRVAGTEARIAMTSPLRAQAIATL